MIEGLPFGCRYCTTLAGHRTGTTYPNYTTATSSSWQPYALADNKTRPRRQREWEWTLPSYLQDKQKAISIWIILISLVLIPIRDVPRSRIDWHRLDANLTMANKITRIINVLMAKCIQCRLQTQNAQLNFASISSGPTSQWKPRLKMVEGWAGTPYTQIFHPNWD